MSFEEFFKKFAGGFPAHGWQSDLASYSQCQDRLIRVPTGFGKTLGVLAAWLWNRVTSANQAWPRRLVWCLPMRVLVEQTELVVHEALGRLGLDWDPGAGHDNRVGVHLLMGGSDAGEWHLHPEHCAVLIGTQDMLLSRAVNRGYGAPRARWPMEFGLLNQDALWVMDEVQLMDVGMATSAQLQAFRHDDAAAGRLLRPCHTWWMSATLQSTWLSASPDTGLLVGSLPPTTTLTGADRAGTLWKNVHKACEPRVVEGARGIADLVAEEHLGPRGEKNGITLVVLNTVDRVVGVWEALRTDDRLREVDIRLVHSRFRPHERSQWSNQFLNPVACKSGTSRIIVATQVVEAGVDISAGLLITELAPWPSLVQRFGRCARWGGNGRVIVVDLQPTEDKAAAPYAKLDLDAARETMGGLDNVAPDALESREASLSSDQLSRLYPYEPAHLLLRREVDELFDTTPDLSGADVDISRFIRSGSERDLSVFWAEIDADSNPSDDLRPAREAICAVPFLRAREWLCGSSKPTARFKQGMRAWVWDWLDGEWRVGGSRDLFPGQTLLVAAECGGYDTERGWSPASTARVTVVASPALAKDEKADGAEDDESLSAYPWMTIATHGLQVGVRSASIGKQVAPQYGGVLGLAGRCHDWGKALPPFQNSIESADRPARRDLAKAPDRAWLSRNKLYPTSDGGRRAGYRHELASVLGLFGILRRYDQNHLALLGPWHELLEAAGMPPAAPANSVTQPNDLEKEILALTSEDFDLLAYLVCAHHGKVRVAWHSSAADQAAAVDRLRIRGVEAGDNLPATILCAANGSYHLMPQNELDLSPAAVGLSPRTGDSWTQRILNLLARHGPFALAFLEALMRAADQRASSTPAPDPLLSSGVKS